MRAKDLSLNVKFLAAFGVVVFLLLIIGAICWRNAATTFLEMEKARKAVQQQRQIQHQESALALKLNQESLRFNIGTSTSDPQGNKLANHDASEVLTEEDFRHLTHQVPRIATQLGSLQQLQTALQHTLSQVKDLSLAGDKEAKARARTIFASTATDLEKSEQLVEQISVAIDDYATTTIAVAQAAAIRNRNTILTLAALAIVAGIAFFFLTSRNITAIARQLALVTEDLASGKMTSRSMLNQKDEMGMLACSANRLATSLNTMCTQVHGSSSTINASSSSLDRLASGLFSTADVVSGNCHTVAVAAEQMNTNMAAIAAASEQTNTNVGMVAAAAEEMTATIKEIASSSENARVVTEQAVSESNRASESVKELGEAAQKINKVTETITEIADQTNMLALNATIEAARAGEAGKGFAIVANEIKELARQTAEATREIQERINGVQKSSEQTIDVINSITGIINDTNNIVASIATAVEEQAATSREIAENVGQASAGIQEVSENIAQASVVNAEVSRDISHVKEESQKVAAASLDVKELAGEMKHNAESLAVLLDRFSFSNPLFDIGRIKDAHFNWKMRLTSVLAGYTTMDSKDIPDHHQCEFGKWYDTAPKKLETLPLFAEVGKHHEAVHRTVMEAVDLHNANDHAGAARKVEEFEQVRAKLFAALDELYMI